MKILVNEKLSQHKYKTPEGYLICVDAILARTGKQTYTRNEVFADGDESEVEIDRTPEEVFSEKTLASFENKPITVEHPDEDVNCGNYKEYSVGFVRDVHKGRVDGKDVILGTLVIQDAQTIEEIENGEHTDLSCGYDCDIVDEKNPQQRNIRGNHVALCAQGRAGNARIVDSVIDVGVHTEELAQKEYDRLKQKRKELEEKVDRNDNNPRFDLSAVSDELESINKKIIELKNKFGKILEDSIKDDNLFYSYASGPNPKGKPIKIRRDELLTFERAKELYGLLKRNKNLIIYRPHPDETLYLNYKMSPSEAKNYRVMEVVENTTPEKFAKQYNINDSISYRDSIKDSNMEKALEILDKNNINYMQMWDRITFKTMSDMERANKLFIKNGLDYKIISNYTIEVNDAAQVDKKERAVGDEFIKNKEGKFYFSPNHWYKSELMARKFQTKSEAENEIRKENLKNVEITDLDSIKDDYKGKPEFVALGKWVWDEEVYDWYDTGRHMYYNEIVRNSGERLGKYPMKDSDYKVDVSKASDRDVSKFITKAQNIGFTTIDKGYEIILMNGNDNMLEKLKSATCFMNIKFEDNIKDEVHIATEIKDEKVNHSNLRKFCIENNYYTSGTIADYTNLLEHCDKMSLEDIAGDIAQHTSGVWTTEVLQKLRKKFGDFCKDEKTTSEKVTEDLEKDFEKFKENKMKDRVPDAIVKLYQDKVDHAIKTFGRIGGGLYDELDDNGLWVDDRNGKYIVKRKVEDSIKDSFKIRYKDFYNNLTYEEVFNTPTLKEAIEELKKRIVYRGIGTSDIYIQHVAEIKKDGTYYHPQAFGKLNSLKFDSVCKDSNKYTKIISAYKALKNRK